MDSEVIAWISAEHRRRLAWFEEHQGDVSAIPGPLADGLLLVSNPKGIYKPGGLPYAVSIRINLDSPYADGMPVPTPGGGWLLSYHQENADPAARDRMYTNRGLMRCIADRVPVGVLRERAPAGRRSQYDVLGLPCRCAGHTATSSSRASLPKRRQSSTRSVMSWKQLPALKWSGRQLPRARPWVTITMPVFVFTGRLSPGKASPGSGGP